MRSNPVGLVRRPVRKKLGRDAPNSLKEFGNGVATAGFKKVNAATATVR